MLCDFKKNVVVVEGEVDEEEEEGKYLLYPKPKELKVPGNASPIQCSWMRAK